MLDNQYKNFLDKISKYISKEYIFTDYITTLAYGTDASCYRLVPKIVIKAQNEDHIRTILKYANTLHLPVTFRGSGTSLSGQAITDSILVITQEGWKNYSISKDYNSIDLDVGIIAAQANSYLQSNNKKIGPDPATINVASIGGIVANNSSGMCCGVEQNSYQTIKDVRVILKDGTLLDTKDKESVESFRKTHKELLQELENLAKEVQSDSELSALITKKYKIKNTTGYSINSLVDFTDGIEILKHLIVGSEGTLAFISSVSYYTVEDYPNKASALTFFPNIEEACNAIIELKKNSDIVESAEFMDRISLKSMEKEQNIPNIIKTLDEYSCAILIQTSNESKNSLQENINKINNILSNFKLLEKPEFSSDPKIYNRYWNIRKGLFTKVGALRRKGTVVIIEDITFPISDLAKGTLALRKLLNSYKYEDAIIFGHALDGNLHFVLCINFSKQKEITNYDNFMHKLTDLLTIEYKGSLKAEHGTGRNIAPFVEREWGNKAYQLMIKIKNIFDKERLINPDVIITEDAQLHLKNLKELKETNPLIDQCIECGFCEPICPTKHLSYTPRQRIASYRYLQNNNINDKKEIASYNYNSIDTCAACSLCSTLCPIGINVANLTKELRYKQKNFLLHMGSILAAKTYFMAIFNLRLGLYLGKISSRILGNNIMKSISYFINKISFRLIPVWRTSFPNPTNHKNLKVMVRENINAQGKEKVVVYFASCLNKIFGERKEHPMVEKDLYQSISSLAKKSGYKIITLADNSLCCSMPFSSKGYEKGADIKVKELEEKLLEASKNGKYPVITDLSSCTLQMINTIKNEKIKIYDIGEFAKDFFVPNLEITKIKEPIALHINCSAQKLNQADNLTFLANLCAEEVIIPKSVSCCGFSGDKGMFYPEINFKALQGLKEEVKDVNMGFSTNCACEIGLSEISQKPYTSILYLLDKTSKAL